MRSISKVLLALSIISLVAINAFAAPDFAAKVQEAMKELKTQCDALGTPKVEGTDAVGDQKDAPALYFGTTKMNNNFDVVDKVKNKVGGTATLFVKKGDEYIRVCTNVQKNDGTRAIGTVLDPNGAAIKEIKQGKAFYGEVDIIGKMYTTGYEPIKKGNEVVGIYYVGYLKIVKQ